MERNSKIWFSIFVLLAALELVGEYLDNRSLIFSIKPFLMPVLAIWLARKTANKRRFLRHTVLAGLLFATLGDTFLMFNRGEFADFFFLIGLGSFLITHLCYLGGFLSEVSLKSGRLRQRPILILPFLLVLFAFLLWLWPDIPVGFRQPVAAYAFVISAMALGVVNLWGKVDKDIFISLIFGALLFMGSDMLIAAHKFGHPIPGARIAIMGTYLLGQWLIVRGVAEKLVRS